MNDKRVADIFESLLGACYRHGGNALALQFLRRAGFDEMIFENDTGVQSRLHIAALSVTDADRASVDVSALEEKLHYSFINKNWLLVALKHPSAHSNVLASQLKFLGDAITDLYVLDRWMMMEHPEKPLSPGDITDLRAAAVMGSSQAAFCLMVDIHKYLIHDSQSLQLHLREYSQRTLPQESISSGAVSFADLTAADAPDPLSAVLEAILGAIFFDSHGLEQVFQFLDRTFKPLFLNAFLDLSQPQLALAPVKQLGEVAARRWCTYLQREYDSSSATSFSASHWWFV